ncbi:MAG: hypothetical protein KGO93_08200, partial [Cyanobacteria bacterium REEB446]|nr:hypothetical protein [Cyanobacteria bacterium REEB446]
STIDKLRDGMREINSRGGTSNDEEVADASSEGTDDTNKTLADKLNDGSKTIAAMTGNINVDDATESLETKKTESLETKKTESLETKKTESLETKEEAIG